MEHKSFSYNGATITCHTETGRLYIRRLTAQVVLGLNERDTEGKRTLSDEEYMERTQFAAIYVQSTVEGDLGFVWPESVNDAPAMSAACESWLNLPGKVIAQWMQTINEVDASPNDPDLKPPEVVSKKSEATPT